MNRPPRTPTIVAAALSLVIASCTAPKDGAPTGADLPPLWVVDTPVESRSACFENPTGEKGGGGRAASNLGVGRKGSAMRKLKPGDDATLCDIAGPGVIRHIWLTTRDVQETYRNLILRAWWDDQAHPSIECPIGDFFGFAHGQVRPYHSAVHAVGEKGALNIWLPMPFTRRARMTLTNEGTGPAVVFYQIDYTVNDAVPANAGRLHVSFRRENPTTPGQDFEILPRRAGAGRFVGCVLGIRSLSPGWWGEGEMKAYLDGDTEFPTICGTGSEDYVCLAWGMQATPYLYNGCSLNEGRFASEENLDLREKTGFLVSMYRWHLPDPIYWKRECRIAIQQIGIGKAPPGHKGPPPIYKERSDDWSAAAFWYEPVPSAPLPPLPAPAARIDSIGFVKAEEPASK